MRKIQHPSVKAVCEKASLSATALSSLADMWITAGQINRHSETTTAARRHLIQKVAWFLDHKHLSALDAAACRAFLLYATVGHNESGGRWGNPRMVKPSKPGTVKTYHRILKAFCNYLVAEGELDVSPMERIPVPIDRPDQIVPFTNDELDNLLAAANRSNNPKRDHAILLLMLDTGVRASELCALLVGDVDFSASAVRVREGKGGKGRTVPFSLHTKKAVYQYLRDFQRDTSDGLFLSDRGGGAGDALTRHGLRFLFRRLGVAAKVSGSRCSPHTMRHSMAVNYLREGGNVFALRRILGHESLTMTNRYVALAQVDLSAAHAEFSPVAALKKGKAKGK